jgi:hypothetical protein
MNLAEIKTKLGVQTLPLTRIMDMNDPTVKTEWLSYWDDDNRVRVLVHESRLETIAGDTNLYIKWEDKVSTTSQKPYRQAIICAATNSDVEVTL